MYELNKLTSLPMCGFIAQFVEQRTGIAEVTGSYILHNKSKMAATWVQLKPCSAHAHGCTRAFLPPVIVALSNFSGVVWTENILSVFQCGRKTFDAFSE